MLAYLCESTIFLNLGIYGAKVLHSHFMEALPLAVWTIILCTGIRFGLVYGITWIMNNLYRTREICYQNQFIMAYGGLRGGIAFSLMMLADLGEHDDQKDLLMCATLMLILFTCFLQGTTIEYFVNSFHVEKQEDNKTVSVEFHNEMIEEVMMGIKAIANKSGREYYYNRWEQWKIKHLNPIFEYRPEHLNADHRIARALMRHPSITADPQLKLATRERTQMVSERTRLESSTGEYVVDTSQSLTSPGYANSYSNTDGFWKHFKQFISFLNKISNIQNILAFQKLVSFSLHYLEKHFKLRFKAPRKRVSFH